MGLKNLRGTRYAFGRITRYAVRAFTNYAVRGILSGLDSLTIFLNFPLQLSVQQFWLALGPLFVPLGPILGPFGPVTGLMLACNVDF